MGRGLLVTHVDDADALGQAAIVDRQDMTAAEREDVITDGPCLRTFAASSPPVSSAMANPRRGRLARSGWNTRSVEAGYFELVLRPDGPPDQLATAVGAPAAEAGLGARPAVGAFERADHGVGAPGGRSFPQHSQVGLGFASSASCSLAVNPFEAGQDLAAIVSSSLALLGRLADRIHQKVGAPAAARRGLETLGTLGGSADDAVAVGERAERSGRSAC